MRWLAEINLVCLLMFQFGRRYMVNLGRLHLLRRPTAVPQIAKQQIHPPDPLKTMTWQSVALSLILQRYSTICSPWCTALLSIYIICSLLGRGLFCMCVCVCVYPWWAICRSLVGRGVLCMWMCMSPWPAICLVQSGRQGVLCMWMCVFPWLAICLVQSVRQGVLCMWMCVSPWPAICLVQSGRQGVLIFSSLSEHNQRVKSQLVKNIVSEKFSKDQVKRKYSLNWLD